MNDDLQQPVVPSDARGDEGRVVDEGVRPVPATELTDEERQEVHDAWEAYRTSEEGLRYCCQLRRSSETYLVHSALCAALLAGWRARERRDSQRRARRAPTSGGRND